MKIGDYHDELLARMERLAGLVREREYGMLTWLIAVADLEVELHAFIGQHNQLTKPDA